ncbi:MAG: 50S ribosomal protein L23 [Candidatus Diapherotrites archaeon]
MAEAKGKEKKGAEKAKGKKTSAAETKAVKGHEKKEKKNGLVSKLVKGLPGGKKGAKNKAGNEERNKKIIEEMKAKKVGKDEQIKAYGIILYPLITEKAVNMIEAENRLVFIVNKSASRTEVKSAVEALYGVKVDAVNIMNDTKSRKRALVKINRAFKAGDVATKLGVI